jgi:hypothetical protein
MQTAPAYSLAIVAIFFTGCATDGSDDDDIDDVADEAGKADGVARPVGTYESATGPIEQLVLRSDKTFERTDSGIASLVAGTYTFTKSGATRYIRFFEDGALLDRYAYRIGAEDTLELRQIYTSDWNKLQLCVTCQDWTDAVKSAYLAHDGFVSITRSALPVAAKELYDDFKRDGGVVHAVKFSVHAHTVFAVDTTVVDPELDERAFSVVIFDRSGTELASGSGSESFGFAWD